MKASYHYGHDGLSNDDYIRIKWPLGTGWVAMSKTGSVFAWEEDILTDVTTAGYEIGTDLPNATWDIACENGGLKRWAKSEPVYDDVAHKWLYPNKMNYLGQSFGNHECDCPSGFGGYVCNNCTNNDGCASGQICETNIPLQDEREISCMMQHNGAIGDLKSLGNDQLIQKIDTKMVRTGRMNLILSKDSSFKGEMMLAVPSPGSARQLQSAYVMKFSAQADDCELTSKECSYWYDRESNGLKAMGLANPWSSRLGDDAICIQNECSSIAVECPPNQKVNIYESLCTDLLVPLFKGSVSLVCNQDSMTNGTLSDWTNFTSTPYSCVLFGYDNSLAFSMPCNTVGQCVDNPTPPTPTPTPPTPVDIESGCDANMSWCYPLMYAIIYGSPVLVTFVFVFMTMSFNAGCLPKDCTGEEAKNESDFSDGAKKSLLANDSLSASYISGAPAARSRVDSVLKMPFLVLDHDADGENCPSKRCEEPIPDATRHDDGQWVHVRNVTFSIPPSLVQQAASKISSVHFGSRRTKILNSVTAAFGPAMNAIMGPSGCGKTSLLDIVAGRKTLGTIQGSVHINGKAVCVNLRKQCIGYVTQEDVLQASSTTRETLAFHAALRMPRCTTLRERALAVESMLKTLKLTKRADTRIGSVDHKGLSGGEKRRVSIGCALLGGTKTLVLDEPLSGLDSSSALTVLETLEKLVANRAHSVIMTVHQPSSRLFSKFHSVMLLSCRGRMVYSGSRRGCMEHFIKIGLPRPPSDYSVAEYLLDVVNPVTSTKMATLNGVDPLQLETGERNNDANVARTRARLERREKCLAKQFEMSSLYASIEALISSLESRASGAAIRGAIEPDGDENGIGGDLEIRVDNQDIELDCDEFSPFVPTQRAKWPMQFAVLIQRECREAIRSPTLALANIGLAAACGLCCAVLYHGMERSLPGLESRAGLMFFSLSYFMLSTIVTLGIMKEARLLYLHEHSSRLYDCFPYFVSRLLVDTLINRLVPVCIYAVLLYRSSNLRWEPKYMLNFGLILFVSSLCSAGVMSCVALTVRSLPTSQLVGAMIAMIWMLLSGLPVNSIVLGSLKWLLYLSPLNYSFNCLMINEFGDHTPYAINPKGMKSSTALTGNQILDQFDIDHT
eukprot:g902.t1